MKIMDFINKLEEFGSDCEILMYDNSTESYYNPTLEEKILLNGYKTVNIAVAIGR